MKVKSVYRNRRDGRAAARVGFKAYCMIGLACLALFGAMRASTHVAAQGEPLRVTANFSEKQPVTPTSQLELRTTRALTDGEGRLAIFVGETDVTALCVKGGDRVTYK